MIDAMPIIRARGKSLPGFFISSATGFRLVQPSYAQSVATVAKAIMPIMPPKDTSVPSGIRDRSGCCLPINRPANRMIAIGIIFATIETFCRMEPILIPRQLYAVKAIISTIAMSLTCMPDRSTKLFKAVASAIASAAIEPEPLTSQLVNPKE